MFQFSGSSYHILFYSYMVVRVLLWRVPPFGHLRIYGYLLLPAAFRSLSRPSSAPDAKAFVVCSSSLDLRRNLFFSLTLLPQSSSFKQFLLLPKKLTFWEPWLIQPGFEVSKLSKNNLSFSFEFLIMWVSLLLFQCYLIPQPLSQLFTVTLFYLKKPFLFSYSFSYSVFKQQIKCEIINISGGDKESRTLDPLLARQVLSQLSYTPIFFLCI